MKHIAWTNEERAAVLQTVREDPDAIAKELASLDLTESSAALRRLFALSEELTADDVCRLVGRCAGSPAMDEALPAALAAWPELMHRLPPDRLTNALPNFLGREAAAGRAGALAAEVAKLPSALDESAKAFFRQWWAHDATGAAAWVKSLPPCPAKTAALEVRRGQVGLLSADVALREIESWVPAPQRAEWWRAWGGWWERTSPAEATVADLRKRLGTAPLETLPVECLEGVGSQTGRSPEEIRRWVQELPEAHAEAFTRGAARRLGFEQGQAMEAAEAFRQWPEHALRIAALEGLGASIITTGGRFDVREWLSTWSAGPERDALVRGMLLSRGGYVAHGEEGLALAAFLTDRSSGLPPFS